MSHKFLLVVMMLSASFVCASDPFSQRVTVSLGNVQERFDKGQCVGIYVEFGGESAYFTVNSTNYDEAKAEAHRWFDRHLRAHVARH